MIDIHCHLLPGVDDGAQSVDEALSMARLAVADGVQTLVVTPHLRNWQSKSGQELLAHVESLQRELKLCGVGLRLVCGAELLLSPDLSEKPGNERNYTLGGSRYLLVELPATDYPLYADEVLFELQLRGLTPILAHPERNVAIQENVRLMQRLVHRGVLGQLTAGSLLPEADRLTRRTAQTLLLRGLVQVIASDGHDPKKRPPCLSPAVTQAARLVGEARARAMVTDVPAAILADRPVETELPPVRLRRRLFPRPGKS